MPEPISPANVTSVLEVLTAVVGIDHSDAWAEVQRIELGSGQTAVACSVRHVLDDGLLVRHVSAVSAGESVDQALQRVAQALEGHGLRSVDVSAEAADQDEAFHTAETLQQLEALPMPSLAGRQIVH